MSPLDMCVKSPAALEVSQASPRYRSCVFIMRDRGQGGIYIHSSDWEFVIFVCLSQLGSVFTPSILDETY